MLVGQLTLQDGAGQIFAAPRNAIGAIEDHLAGVPADILYYSLSFDDVAVFIHSRKGSAATFNTEPMAAVGLRDITESEWRKANQLRDTGPIDAG